MTPAASGTWLMPKITVIASGRAIEKPMKEPKVTMHKRVTHQPVLCEFAFTQLSALEKYPGNVVAKRSDRVKCNAALAYQIFPTACCR